jgi:hypothetical protein
MDEDWNLIKNKKISELFEIQIPSNGTASSKPMDTGGFFRCLILVLAEGIGRFLRIEFDRRGSLGKSNESFI